MGDVKYMTIFKGYRLFVSSIRCISFLSYFLLCRHLLTLPDAPPEAVNQTALFKGLGIHIEARSQYAPAPISSQPGVSAVNAAPKCSAAESAWKKHTDPSPRFGLEEAKDEDTHLQQSAESSPTSPVSSLAVVDEDKSGNLGKEKIPDGFFDGKAFDMYSVGRRFQMYFDVMQWFLQLRSH